MLFDCLYATLHIADVGTILLDTARVGWAGGGLQVRRALRGSVENAAGGGIGSYRSEELLEHYARIDFGTQRRGGRCPTNSVRVRRAVAETVRARRVDTLNAELNRGTRR